ncbi:MAG TPA: sensor histidine kinase [Pseudorhodoplanes sp.]|jgi:signal transduction histidine kinase|nr:sensor histidine kinase [Pseudorhodoplanes sp.]
MRANSLALRLFLSATAWTVVTLIVTGFVLSSLYRQAVERSFDRRLGVYLRTLVADVASPEDNTADKFPQSVSEPLFELPLSGWYWQVTRLDVAKPDIRASRSLWDTSLPRLPEQPSALPGALRQGYVQGPEDQKLRLVERIVDLGDEGRFLVSVAGDSAEIEEETGQFDRALMVTFGLLALVLLLITAFQVQFGLAPLRRISQGLASIRAGLAERLEGHFPVEIDLLARETNALLEANREIVERARTHVGNLAHALKTPLSVMVNEATARGDDPLAIKVREQIEIMRDQVTRHLERARLAARMTVVGSITDVYPVVQSLARTMEKTHHDKGLAIRVDAPHDARFLGERQDLEEMIGNLVDNACKWAQSRVSIEVLSEVQEQQRHVLRIVVDDDGRGLTPSEREQVARRGRRLDETKPGSGLGLSIVLELASLYGGSLTLGTAPIGGLRAELVLPAA